jgi:D-3-phosphoglycerate dehydrogenase
MNNVIRILNAEPLSYSDEARTVLKQLGELAEGPFKREELLSRLPDCEVLIVRLAHQIDQEMIEAGIHLNAIVSATTGLDHIDVDYARSKGIAVLSLQGENEFLSTISATAEHAWALLLSLLRRIPPAYTAVRAGDWNRDAFRGYELDGKRLGILGLGRIGRKIARYGLAFGMEVAAYDPYVERWVDHAQRLSGLQELLTRSDILSINVPLNVETRGLISRNELALLPAGSVLVNTSRGEIIDEVALVQALASGHLAGAALDVVAHERQPEMRTQSPLIAYARAHDNLLITPHIAGATYESMIKTEAFMAHKLAAFLKN